jgi:hypothetical protein
MADLRPFCGRLREKREARVAAALLAEWNAKKRAALAIELAALLRRYDVSDPETAAAVMLRRLDTHKGD